MVVYPSAKTDEIVIPYDKPIQDWNRWITSRGYGYTRADATAQQGTQEPFKRPGAMGAIWQDIAKYINPYYGSWSDGVTGRAIASMRDIYDNTAMKASTRACRWYPRVRMWTDDRRGSV